MKLLNNLPIAYKLIGGYLVVVIILIGIGWTGITSVNQMADQTNMLYEDNTIPLTEIGNIEVSLNSIRALTFRCIAIPEENKFDISRIETEVTNINSNLSLLQTSSMNTAQAESFQVFLTQWDVYNSTVNQFLKYLSENKIDSAKSMIMTGGEHANARRATVSTFAEMKSLALANAIQHTQTAMKNRDQTTAWMIQLLVLVSLISVIIGIILTRNITRPLSHIRTVLAEIENGNLSGRLNLNRTDEIGKLADSLDHFSEYLQLHIISRLKALGDGEWVDYLTPRDTKDQIAPALNAMIGAVTSMEEEVMNLTKASAAGNLSVRSDLSRFSGAYKEIIRGFNTAMDSIIAPVQEVKKVSASYASGNLTAQFSPDIIVQGEFLEMKETMNHIGTELSQVLIEVLSEMEKLEEISHHMQDGISGVSTGSELLKNTVESVNTHTKLMQDKYQTIFHAMEGLSQAVVAVTNRTELVSGLSQKTNDDVKSGTLYSKSAEEGMNTIDQSVHHVESLIHKIKGEMAEIQSIVTLISDISDKTNLLALNAAIEAARAGNVGLGFAVVAGEVKQLANESQQSTGKVANIISNLMNQTDEINSAMMNTVSLVSTGHESVVKTTSLFSEMVLSIDTLSDHMIDVASASQEQAATVEEMSREVKELNEIVSLLHTETSAASREAAIEDEATSQSFSEVNQVMETLNVSVSSIKKMIDKFVLISENTPDVL